MADTTQFDVAVVGGGPAGLTASILIAKAGLRTACYAGAQTADARTTALMLGAIRLLDHVGVWPSVGTVSAPLRRLRLIDDTDWSVKAPSVTFEAGELDEEAFGWNIPNEDLAAALRQTAGGLEGLTLIGHAVKRIVPNAGQVDVIAEAGEPVSARLVVGADGRNSLCRDAAGITTTDWSYPQTAVACSFSHERLHEDTSTEFHKSAGPLTLVPLPGRRSSLVWVATPERAREMAASSPETFEHVLVQETHGLLGAISASTPRGLFDIKGMTVRDFARERVALIGEAAHVLPPIGAQGLNLGLRDAALIAELVADAHARGTDIGADDVLRDYDRRRRRDVAPRIALVDILNRSLFSGNLPLQGLRGLGLFMLDTVGPLRREVMRHGMEPPGDLPRLMQK
ncbi:MAG: UbiH/UbiF family hydroxylase [Hyphomicrobiales bacterium]